MSELLEYKCPRCGAAISFDTSSQKMKCPYCDTEFDIDSVRRSQENLGEDEMKWKNEGQEWTDSHMRVYICNSCGGEVIADDVTAASQCPYCSNPVIMKGNLSGELRPDLIIPFKLDKNVAVEKFKEHLSGKRLLPKIFRTESKIKEIKGVYVPFWLYDTGADVSVSYKAEKVRHWSDGDSDYTERSYYAVYREGMIDFENIPVDASIKMNDALMDSIEPFDFSEAVAFTSAYLSGFLADKYDASKEECSQRANLRIKRTTENAFRSTVQGYSSVDRCDSKIILSGGRIRYALLPVWVMNVRWKGEKYTFAMNGQTCKFVGNLPLDKGAYARWFLLLTAAGAAVTSALMMLMQMFF